MLPAIFLLTIVIALAIFLSGRKSKPYPPGSMKTEPYACGEKVTPEEVHVDLNRFLVFAVYFLIFDLLAFTIATSFFDLGLAPVIYSLVVLMSITMLAFMRRRG